MNTKQQVFVENYLKTWNATQSAKAAGYAHPRQAGHRLLTNVDISAEISGRVAELAMSADEVLLRLAEQARSNLGDFITTGLDGELTLSLKGPLHLLKKISLTGEGLQVELYDAQKALKLLGQHHKLFTQRHELDVPELEPLPELLQQLVDKVYGTESE